MMGRCASRAWVLCGVRCSFSVKGPVGDCELYARDVTLSVAVHPKAEFRQSQEARFDFVVNSVNNDETVGQSRRPEPSLSVHQSRSASNHAKQSTTELITTLHLVAASKWQIPRWTSRRQMSMVRIKSLLSTLETRHMLIASQCISARSSQTSSTSSSRHTTSKDKGLKMP